MPDKTKEGHYIVDASSERTVNHGGDWLNEHHFNTQKVSNLKI